MHTNIHTHICRSQSAICLPPLPANCKSVLDKFNATALKELISMAHSSASSLPPQNASLPLSKTAYTSNTPNTSDFAKSEMVKLQTEADSLSGPYAPYTLLSGAHARNSLEGVLRTARRDICAHKSAMPILSLNLSQDAQGEEESPINAYVYDFYMHSHFATIVKDNGVSSGDAWQVIFLCVCSCFVSV
jgi:hypothetical protein